MQGVIYLVIAAMSSCIGVAQADDWPQWRGPNRDGAWRETGILETFPSDGLKVRWRAQVGAGLSSPIVAEGRVYVTDVGSDSKLMKPKALERVQCFDEATGRVLWTYQYEAQYYDWAFDPKSPNGPSCTPLVQDGRVFTRGAAGDLCCLDAIKGTVVWKRNTSTEYGLAELSGTTPSPVIEGNLLIIVVGGKPEAGVLALDKNSGKEIWRALSDRWTYSSPIVITAGGQRQLIVWTPEAVISLDPVTGKMWWRHPMTTLYADATPIFDHDLLLVSGVMFQLDPDKPAASVLWHRRLNDTSIPLLQDGCVYADTSNGRLVCLDARTGQQVWETDKVTDHQGGASIHLTPNGGSVLLFTDQGNLIRARLTRQGYEELSRVHLIDPTYTFGGREVVWPPPAYANRHVFVRSDKELVCASLEAKP